MGNYQGDTAMMTDIDDLISRLAAASGDYDECRRLDAAIAVSVGWVNEKNKMPHASWRDPNGHYHLVPPVFTLSLDSAKTLVQEGYRLYSLSDQMDDSLGRWFAGVANDVPPIVNPPATSFMGHAPTPALALCIACLRARQQ